MNEIRELLKGNKNISIHLNEFICIVFPGDAPTLAKFLRLRILFITDDFPTLDFPANMICGRSVSRKPSGFAADFINSAICKFRLGLFSIFFSY
jgi:hypothetical protein